MRACLFVFSLSLALSRSPAQTPVDTIADNTNYNVGDQVRLRLQPPGQAQVSIRYTGETNAVIQNIPVSGAEYGIVWNVPADARTGRYDVDLLTASGQKLTAATSFAVHRQIAKVASVEMDKTFYTSGDSVNPIIIIRNLSDKPIDHLQVEFEPYTYPWIAPDPDDPPMWKHVVDNALSLAPHEQREFRVQKAAVVQAGTAPVAIYYSVVVRDSRYPDLIYDLAFAPPAFTIPPNTPLPKQYPFLYLYWRLTDLNKSEAYRTFYPPEFVSSYVHFDTSHTIFPTGTSPVIPFSVTSEQSQQPDHLRLRVLDQAGHELENRTLHGSVSGLHSATLSARGAGNYMLQVSFEDKAGATVARNQLEFSIDKLPKSILVFCAHQDDDTAHPGMIRAAVENHIPIHVVYLTGGDAGGCDRFYMHSCDAARAMDFGEVRMEEARASLGHLGVPRSDIFFLGLPDGGLGQIWEATKSDHPYLSVLLASEHAPYREAAIPNLAYAKQPVIAELKKFIERFHPDLIITGHPDERHVDHRTNNWLVVEAMHELVREGSLSRNTTLLVDQVYGARPDHHAPYRYEAATFFVPGEVAKLGQEALWYYQSQEGNHQQAEIKEFIKLPRREAYPHFQILDWQDHEGWNEP